MFFIIYKLKTLKLEFLWRLNVLLYVQNLEQCLIYTVVNTINVPIYFTLGLPFKTVFEKRDYPFKVSEIPLTKWWLKAFLRLMFYGLSLLQATLFFHCEKVMILRWCNSIWAAFDHKSINMEWLVLKVSCLLIKLYKPNQAPNNTFYTTFNWRT